MELHRGNPETSQPICGQDVSFPSIVVEAARDDVRYLKYLLARLGYAPLLQFPIYIVSRQSLSDGLLSDLDFSLFSVDETDDYHPVHLRTVIVASRKLAECSTA